MKKFIIMASIVTIIAFLSLMRFLNYIQQQYINPEYIVVDKVELENGEWVIKGQITEPYTGFLSNKVGFSGVDIKIKNESLYIKLQYGIVSGRPAEQFGIYLGTKLDRVEKVYLQGNQTDEVKLVWYKN
ncbi:hypothetical protein [Solibacillus sp. CAU 1738]|uniref:hypothetical protein n=1 Tax=Solibacillus sp. CAU 1738 TaxID=3140363 RepID=UPI00326185FA